MTITYQEILNIDTAIWPLRDAYGYHTTWDEYISLAYKLGALEEAIKRRHDTYTSASYIHNLPIASNNLPLVRDFLAAAQTLCNSAQILVGTQNNDLIHVRNLIAEINEKLLASSDNESKLSSPIPSENKLDNPSITGFAPKSNEDEEQQEEKKEQKTVLNPNMDSLITQVLTHSSVTSLKPGEWCTIKTDPKIEVGKSRHSELPAIAVGWLQIGLTQNSKLRFLNKFDNYKPELKKNCFELLASIKLDLTSYLESQNQIGEFKPQVTPIIPAATNQAISFFSTRRIAYSLATTAVVGFSALLTAEAILQLISNSQAVEGAMTGALQNTSSDMLIAIAALAGAVALISSIVGVTKTVQDYQQEKNAAAPG